MNRPNPMKPFGSRSRLPIRQSAVILAARARGIPVHTRVFSRFTAGTPGGSQIRQCYPGYCFDDHGMICCVTHGDTHLCVAKCFGYDKGKSHKTSPTIKART